MVAVIRRLKITALKLSLENRGFGANPSAESLYVTVIYIRKIHRASGV